LRPGGLDEAGIVEGGRGRVPEVAPVAGPVEVVGGVRGEIQAEGDLMKTKVISSVLDTSGNRAREVWCDVGVL
jgi:hypothetical protein